MKTLPYIIATLCLLTILTTSGQAQNLPSGQQASDQTEVAVFGKIADPNHDIIIEDDTNPPVPASKTASDTPAGKFSRTFATNGETLLSRQTASVPEVWRIQTNASVQKRNGLIMAGAGIAAIAFGAVTYSMLNKDHKDYRNTIANAEGITSYASPGIYIAGGAAAAGLGLSLASIPRFRKAR